MSYIRIFIWSSSLISGQRDEKEKISNSVNVVNVVHEVFTDIDGVGNRVIIKVIDVLSQAVIC